MMRKNISNVTITLYYVYVLGLRKVCIGRKERPWKMLQKDNCFVQL
jgi:hypothetical protein